ncbi:hypothetical protein ACIA8K_22860 [Catenuloplanes sp. NPDC051500]|uniref:hypothetical protein n=1 Tax=Catenuloplanes sp. NPDC051500 TaxID=3363959 RepID=UPI00379DBAF3
MTAGWPVLVAAGRRRDYSTVLAPGFLVAARTYGVLADSLRMLGPDDPPRVIPVAAVDGVRFHVAYAAHDVTAEDLHSPDAPIRDEHGRPLRFLYGFAWREGEAGEPVGADLEAALGEAVRAYRHFLADEEGFTVLASRQFPLRTPVRVVASAAGPASRGRAVVAAAGALIAMITLLVLLLPHGGDKAPACTDPAVCPPPTAPSRSIPSVYVTQVTPRGPTGIGPGRL